MAQGKTAGRRHVVSNPDRSGALRALRVDLGATAGAGALALAGVTSVAVPVRSEGSAGWADAIVNEWIVWFVVLYVVLLAGSALRQHLADLMGRQRNPGGNHNDHV